MKMTESTRAEMHRREAVRHPQLGWLLLLGVVLGVVISLAMNF